MTEYHDDDLFYIFNLETFEPSQLKENSILQYCTLTRIEESKERKSGEGMRTPEITGFGLRKGFLEDGTIKFFIMCAEPLDKTLKDAVRKIKTSRIINLTCISSDTIEISTESGSRYRIQYFNRAD